MSFAARAVCSGVMVNGWLVERKAMSTFLMFRISGKSSVSPEIYTRKPSRVSMKPLPRHLSDGECSFLLGRLAVLYEIAAVMRLAQHP